MNFVLVISFIRLIPELVAEANAVSAVSGGEVEVDFVVIVDSSRCIPSSVL